MGEAGLKTLRTNRMENPNPKVGEDYIAFEDVVEKSKAKHEYSDEEIDQRFNEMMREREIQD